MHTTCIGQNKIAYTDLVAKSEEPTLLKDQVIHGSMILKWILKKYEYIYSLM